LEVLELVIRERDFFGRNHAKPKRSNMVRREARLMTGHAHGRYVRYVEGSIRQTPTNGYAIFEEV
jgi:hypothetical protein